MEDSFDGPAALTGPLTIPESNANTATLGRLHGVVAEYLTQAIATGKAPPALISAAIAFLKNNNITASIERNAGLASLGEQLAAKRGRALTKKGMNEAAEHLNALYGETGIQ